MKAFAKASIFFMTCALIFSFTSCETEHPDPEYNVLFDSNGGIPSYKGITLKFGSYIPLSQFKVERNGYDFKGWYNGDTKVDSETMVLSNMRLTAEWKPRSYRITYAGLEGASNPNTVRTYTIESENIILRDAEKTGSVFVGWKNGEDFVTVIPKGSTGNITLTAVWGPAVVIGIYIDKTELVLDEGESKTLKASIFPADAVDKTVSWSSSDENVATVTDGIVTAVSKGSAVITAKAGGKTSECMVTVKEIVFFGSWPQTIKAADVTITDETKSAGMFTYYKGSDGEWYAKIAETPCTDYYTYTYSDGSTADRTGRTEKYFKVEPIKWRVLTDNYNGKKLLLADRILVNCAYYDYSNVTRAISGETVYSNNYMHSRIRAYLNGLSYQKKKDSSAEQIENGEYYGKGFLQTAFTPEEIEKIATVIVDNSARSTNPNKSPSLWNIGKNLYACNNTEDKIFLLSEQEVTTQVYGFELYNAHGEGNERIRIATDFAKACGVYQSYTDDYGSWWWLRSPDNYSSYYYNDYSVHIVSDSGSANDDSYVYYSYGGVVPALCLE